MARKTVHEDPILHNNALACKAALILKLLADFWCNIFPYAFILLLLVPELHKEICGHCFHLDEALQNFVYDYFQKMDATFYRLGILKLVQRYNECFDVFGDYVQK